MYIGTFAKVIMRLIIYIFTLLGFTHTIAQQLTVVDTEKSSYLGGSKLREGITLSTDKQVKIRTGGYVRMKYRHWEICLTPGIYKLDSVVFAQRQRREYIVDDSVYSILEAMGLTNCQLKGIRCGNPYKYLNPSYKDERFVRALSDTVVLEWENEVNFAGPYYVVLFNIWEEYLDIHTTDKPELLLSLHPYKKQDGILFKVISADCFESDTRQIRIE